jgi:hypothetical protein
MTYSEIRMLIDAALASIPRLQDCRREVRDEALLCSLDRQAVAISPSGPTGILVRYFTGESTVHARIFAASPLSVDRIAHTAAEHLTAYTFHRT